MSKSLLFLLVIPILLISSVYADSNSTNAKDPQHPLDIDHGNNTSIQTQIDNISLQINFLLDTIQNLQARINSDERKLEIELDSIAEIKKGLDDQKWNSGNVDMAKIFSSQYYDRLSYAENNHHILPKNIDAFGVYVTTVTDHKVFFKTKLVSSELIDKTNPSNNILLNNTVIPSFINGTVIAKITDNNYGYSTATYLTVLELCNITSNIKWDFDTCNGEFDLKADQQVDISFRFNMIDNDLVPEKYDYIGRALFYITQ